MMNFQENLSKIRMRNGDWRDEGFWLGGGYLEHFLKPISQKSPDYSELKLVTIS